MAPTNHHVAEMQGLYGPFTLTERVVQKIWLRGDFNRTRLRLTDGRSLELRSTGTWNLLGGPDFRAARLIIDGRPVTGEVEIHFHAADWRAHGHAADPAYNEVALHVVLFPPDPGETPPLRNDGREMPTLVLLPLLHRDLEEYASDDALEGITARDVWERFAGLAALPPFELTQLLRAKAGERWRQKVHFAGRRMEKLGWAAAAHHTALEILGYQRNRAAMLTVATRYPLELWRNGAEPVLAYEMGRGFWQVQGVRPVNQPLTRLRQYHAWVRAVPAWPEELGRLGGQHLPPTGLSGAGEDDTKQVRSLLELGGLRDKFSWEICGGAVSGPRLDNLVCDGFLPLLAARTGADLSGVWFHWFAGDAPGQVREALVKLGVAGRGGQPHCQGWTQGLLGWMLTAGICASP